jgi:protein-S-isoprenylcysteine O-methyltransferase Ste14
MDGADKCLVAAIANSVLVFFTFLVSVPAMVAPMTRGWLKFHGYLVVVCAIFTMLIGLTIWFDTLKTRQNLSDIWNVQPSTTQSLLQQRVCPPSFPLSQQIRGNGKRGNADKI